MTAAPTTVEWPNLLVRKDTRLWRLGWMGWNQWIVPSKALSEFVEQNYKLLDAPEDELGNGWRQYLSTEIAAIRGGTVSAAYRRLSAVMHGEQRIVNAEFAEAVVMSFGLYLDRDTDIPTLPGCTRLAEDLIRVRSGINNQMEVKRLGRTVIRVSALILAYPHNTARLQNLAPFNCLKPY